MKRIIFLLFTILVSHVAKTQVMDDFTDGNFTANPIWTTNDDGLWQVDNEELRSNSLVANTFYVSTPSTLAAQTEWQFAVNLKFSTSGVNFVDVFLMSDNANLELASNGYFVRLGGTQDEIVLYNLIGGVATPIIDNAEGVINSSSNNPFVIKVTRESDNWTLFYDDGAAGAFTTAGSVEDNSVSVSAHFGFLIEQSGAAGPRMNHFFDNVIVQEIIPDTSPPLAVDVVVSNSNQLTITFDESLEMISAERLNNYSLNNGFGNPVSAELVAGIEVLLTYPDNFITGDYTLTITSVEDLNGNSIITEKFSFSHFVPDVPAIRDVIITEIMADPEPSVGLPDTDYIEIFNNSNKTFDLINWTIADGNSSATLSTYILPPDEYLILTSAGSATDFASFGNVLGVMSFPNFNNSGDDVLLRDNTDLLLDQVIYDDSWYRSSIKDEGGYSLEVIDLTDFCSTADNWIASESSNGGTPGQQNSVFSSIPDNIGPELLNAFGTSPDTITLIFNELLDESSIQSAQYQLSNDLIIENISSIDLITVFLKLSSSSLLQTGSVYEITVTNVSDCPGNIIGNQNMKRFSLIESGEPGDLIINEILFNPKVGGDDFLEIYNNSDRFISLKNWKLANGEILNDSLITGTIRTITDEMSIVGPQEYRAITTDNISLQDFYPGGQSDNYIEAALPSFSDDNGVVVLMNPGEETMDLFAYTEDYHSTILNDNEGVSLERISFDEPTQNADNWISAASNVGFATPGYQNSQIKMINTPGTGSITIDPKVVIPDGDGQNDFTTIGYSFDQQGYVATVTVYDIAGRVVKSLASNDFLPSSGFYTWDGTDDEGRIAKMGYYIVYFEAFDSVGNTLSFKEKVVIGTRF